MAKAKKKTAKRSSSRPKRSKATGRSVAPKARKKSAKPVKQVELKKLREQFAGMLSVLSSKRSASSEVTAKLDDTRRRISQWMTDIDDICSPELEEICGPAMVFPLP